ncbi:MAG: DUF4202 domain-containing protein [Cyclobacteriaceae bacterium]
MQPTSDRFTRAIAAFDAYHEKDPHTESEDGRVYPKELLYARRMTERLSRFAPDADEAVRLAARCQHIGRWEISREKYPMDRKGYLQWRNEEKIRHAQMAEKILSECGYDSETIEKVKVVLLKKELYTNPSTQMLEDVVCLVFVEYYLEEFASRHEDEKIVDILRKTLKKMSEAGKQALGAIRVSDKIRSLTERALLAS